MTRWIDKAVIVAVTVLLPVIVVPYYLENVFMRPKALLMMGAVFVLVSWALFVKADVLTKPDTARALVLVLILLAFNNLYTVNPYYTRHASVMFACSLGLIWVMGRGRWSEGWLDGLQWAIVAGGCLVSFEAVLEFFAPVTVPLLPVYTPGAMIISTCGNSNYTGSYLIFPLIAATDFAYRGRKIAVIALVLIACALAMTRARAAWAGACIGLAAYAWLQYRSGWRIESLRRTLLLTVLALSLLGLSVTYGPPRWRGLALNAGEGTSIRLRVLKYWRVGWELWRESEWVGNGIWSYRNQVYRIQGQIAEREPEFFDGYDDPKPRKSHNEYIDVLCDTGIIGASILLFALVTILRHGWRKMLSGDRHSLLALACLAGIMVNAVWFFPWRIDNTLWHTALMLGVMERT
jgi:O-antigen ligase